MDQSRGIGPIRLSYELHRDDDDDLFEWLLSDFSLRFMGFRLDYELVVKGFLFRKGKMKIVISKLYKVPNHGKYDQVSLRGCRDVTIIQTIPLLFAINTFSSSSSHPILWSNSPSRRQKLFLWRAFVAWSLSRSPGRFFIICNLRMGWWFSGLNSKLHIPELNFWRE